MLVLISNLTKDFTVEVELITNTSVSATIFTISTGTYNQTSTLVVWSPCANVHADKSKVECGFLSDLINTKIY